MKKTPLYIPFICLSSSLGARLFYTIWTFHIHYVLAPYVTDWFAVILHRLLSKLFVYNKCVFLYICVLIFVERSSTIECYYYPTPQIWKRLQVSELALYNKEIFSYKEKRYRVIIINFLLFSSFAQPQSKCLLLLQESTPGSFNTHQQSRNGDCLTQHKNKTKLQKIGIYVCCSRIM
jgi:hypothetical protein